MQDHREDRLRDHDKRLIGGVSIDSFTPKEIEEIVSNPVYVDNLRLKQWSTLTSATIQALLNAVKLDGSNIGLQKYLIFLLAAKREEEREQLFLNEEVMAAIVQAGGDPRTNSYPLKYTTNSMTVAGGAGLFPTETLIAAVTGKKIFLEEVIWAISSEADDNGVSAQLRDGAGGSILTTGVINTQRGPYKIRPLRAGTAATLLEVTAALGGMTALADTDIVTVEILYREI